VGISRDENRFFFSASPKLVKSLLRAALRYLLRSFSRMNATEGLPDVSLQPLPGSIVDPHFSPTALK